MELTKSQKKTARILINQALEIECNGFMKGVKEALQQDTTESSHARYLKLYKMVDEFDEHIAARYDRLSGAHYLDAVAGLFFDDVLSETDIEQLGDEISQWLIRLKNDMRGEETVNE